MKKSTKYVLKLVRANHDRGIPDDLVFMIAKDEKHLSTRKVSRAINDLIILEKIIEVEDAAGRLYYRAVDKHGLLSTLWYASEYWRA